MLVCGIGPGPNGAAQMVVLEPFGDQVSYRSSIEPPLTASKAARWVNSVARRFAPTPLWIAVSGMKWHWLKILETLPVRWVQFEGDPYWSNAHALAKKLNLELQDQISHAFLRSCTERLANIIELQACRRPPPEQDDVPF